MYVKADLLGHHRLTLFLKTLLTRWRTSLWVALLIPTELIAYSSWALRINISAVGLLDHLVFIGLFFACYATATFWIPRPFSKPIRLLGVGLAIFFFIGNLFYFRFYNTWFQWEQFTQWTETLAIPAAILGLTKPADLVFGLFIPLGLCLLQGTLSYKPSRRISLSVLVACAALLMINAAVPRSMSYADHNPLFYIARQAFQEVLRPRDSDRLMDSVMPARNRFKVLNKSLYRLDPSTRYPFEQIPLASAPPSRWIQGRKPNVVFILMESFRAYEMGAYGASPSLTPNLDQIAAEGMVFEHYYSNATQTAKSEFSILCSFLPSYLGGNSYRQGSHLHALSLPAILKDHGYSTLWVYGLDPKYYSADHFLRQHGYDELYYKVPLVKGKVGLGPSDEDIYRYARDLFRKQKQPFFAEILTLSNHFPFRGETDDQNGEIHGDPGYKNYREGIRYTDHALGEFLSSIRDEPWAKNTLFVFTGDHGLWLFPPNVPETYRRQEIYFRMPLVFWAPAFLEPARIPTLGSHIDLAPTLLDLLNIRTKNFFLGASLLRTDTDKRFVIMMHDERWNLREQDHYVYDVGPEMFLDHFPYIHQTPQKKNLTHKGFIARGDLLLGGAVEPMSPQEQHAMEEFATDALKAYLMTLKADRVSAR